MASSAGAQQITVIRSANAALEQRSQARWVQGCGLFQALPALEIGGHSVSNPSLQVVVAIPVKDEEDRLAACLEALDQQTSGQANAIFLLLNNCRDGSAAVAQEMAARSTTPILFRNVELPTEDANAGHARRLAMDIAAEMAGASGFILTTDADGRVDPDWIGVNKQILQAGADAVAGWAELDPIDWGRLPLVLHEDDARECAYDALCDEIHALLDPDSADPLPRHTQNSGASLAVTVAAYRAAGGIPDIVCGEDRAFIAALRRIDARIRHAPECRVVVSGRTVGRALGGMAETINRRLSAADLFLDDRLEPAINCARRATLRYLTREFWRGRVGLDTLAVALNMELKSIAATMQQQFQGVAWETLEQVSGELNKTPVSTANIGVQSEIATRILAAARKDAAACRSKIVRFADIFASTVYSD